MLKLINNKWLNSQYQDTYFSTKVIILAIIFLSQFIFAYDEEKVVVLCLISFVVIAYNNVSLTVYKALQEKKIDFELEFLVLFHEKIALMKRLRFYWRIFLDLEDLTIELYSWIRKQVNSIISKKIYNRKHIINHFLKDKYKFLINNKLSTQKTLNKIYWKLLVKNLDNKSSGLNNNFQLLKNINTRYTLTHLLLNKLDLKTTSTRHINYNAYAFALLK